MKKDDFDNFKKLWSTMFNTYGKECGLNVIKLAYNVLKKYTYSEIKESVFKHLSDKNNGRFLATPSAIKKNIEDKKRREKEDIENRNRLIKLKKENEDYKVNRNPEKVEFWLDKIKQTLPKQNRKNTKNDEI